jgi:hypothetical protein
MNSQATGSTEGHKLSPERELPAFSEDGVDLTLIRWMLSLTPTERLDMLQQFASAVLRIRHESAGSP